MSKFFTALAYIGVHNLIFVNDKALILELVKLPLVFVVDSCSIVGSV